MERNLKVVILAGGYGTRLSEETLLKPKPMVEIGERPILWHIMKRYSMFGLNEFIICCGYKGMMIKEYFYNYYYRNSDISINLANNSVDILNNECEPWQVTLVDTGTDTMTGGRLRRVEKYIDSEDFCFTYGDGVSDINMDVLIKNHRQSRCQATMTAVQPPGRFGAIKTDGNKITSFTENQEGDGAWVNGGFFVLNKSIFSLLTDDSTVWEASPLQQLASSGQLNSFKHKGFWQSMDTLRDKNYLDSLCHQGNVPWLQK